MKKYNALLILLFISFQILDAQNSYIKDRWNIKAGYASYPGFYKSDSGIKESYGNYRLEANYGLLEFMEIGGYLGYSRVTSFLPVAGPLYYENQNTPFFGFNLNFHPLTFLIRKPDFRLDLYLLGRYGGVYYSSPEGYSPGKGLLFQYQHGVGLSYYLSKHFGIFGEYSFGILAKASGNLRCGLSVKF